MSKSDLIVLFNKFRVFLRTRSRNFWILFVINFLLYSTPPLGFLFSFGWWFTVTNKISKKKKKIVSFLLIGFFVFIFASYAYGYNNDPVPTLEISSISNNQVVQSPNVQILGSYSPSDFKLYINGVLIEAKNGEIDSKLALVVGENKVEVKVRNYKSVIEELTIIRELSPEEIARKEAELERLRKEEEDRIREEEEKKEIEANQAKEDNSPLSNVISTEDKTIETPSPVPTPTLKPTVVTSPTPVVTTLTVSRVIDGDTIELSNGQKVRYIGIDTPETVHPTVGVECYGKEASNKNKELVLGKQVRLEKDVSETDRYGRLLRYVYVGNTFVNDYLVRQGYAESSSYPPDVKYQSKFSEAEREARNNSRGLWGSTCDTYVEPTTSTSTYVPPVTSGSCKYSCSSPDRDCSDFSSHVDAVNFFNCCGFTATNDPMRLDSVGVGNGDPCESL